MTLAKLWGCANFGPRVARMWSAPADAVRAWRVR